MPSSEHGLVSCHRQAELTVAVLISSVYTHHLVTACWVHPDGIQLAGKPADKKTRRKPKLLSLLRLCSGEEMFLSKKVKQQERDRAEKWLQPRAHSLREIPLLVKR